MQYTIIREDGWWYLGLVGGEVIESFRSLRTLFQHLEELTIY